MTRGGAQRRVLIIGGTADARELARRLEGRSDLEPILSLAGRTRRPRLPPGRVRIGGFGGADGLARYLGGRAIDLLVDASHPFAARISRHAAFAAAAAGIPLLCLRRPPWPGSRGEVVEAADVAGALAAAATRGRRALVAFRLDQDVAQWGLEIVVRAVEPPGRPPPSRVVWRLARGPYRFDDERRLLDHLGIDVVVAKASGGPEVSAKLEAAAALGVPVILVRRPPAAEAGHVVGGVEDAVRWIEAHFLARST